MKKVSSKLLLAPLLCFVNGSIFAAPPAVANGIYCQSDQILLSDASASKAASTALPALKSEKPMMDSSKPAAPPPKSSPPAAQQSPSGYFIPPDVINNGTPPAQEMPQQGNYGGAGGSSPAGNTFPSFPTENAIPEFGRPLPSVPTAMNTPNQSGGWATGLSPSSDEARVGRLEKSVLGSTYTEHDLIDRVEHLEEEVFKAKGSGPMDARLKKMETMVFGQSTPFSSSPPPSPNPPVQAMQPPSGGAQPPRAPYQLAPYPASPQPPAQITQPYQPYQPQHPSQPNIQPNIYAPNGQPPGMQSSMPGYGSQPPAYRPGYQGGPQQGGGASGYANQYPSQPMQQAPYSGQGGYGQYGSQPTQGGYPGQVPPPNYYPSNPANIPPNNQRMGGAPYTPPPTQYQYGASQQPYGNRPPVTNPNPQYRPPAQLQQSQPPSYATDTESKRVAGQITADAQAGDYFADIRKFQNGNLARWQHFPVLVHLPPNTPEAWRKSLNDDVKKWSLYVPLKTAADYESFVIDVKWENKLPPLVFGITRVEGSGAGLKVVIFLLRPTFYPADVPEKTLQSVFLHELGHAVGLFGHSGNPADVMYLDQKSAKKSPPMVNVISQRDLNTLKRVYMTPPISDSFLIQPPLEYTSH